MTATLRVGMHFDVVQLPSGIVENGMRGIKDQAAVADHFRAAGITSAVIVSRTQTRYFVLVPPGTARDWAEPGTQCIGSEHRTDYLGVPTPTRREPPGAYWLMPAPDDGRMLCDPANIRLLIGKARKRPAQRALTPPAPPTNGG
ncbi:hypothetical protein LKL35_04910 [Streptomyces sp. ET3-23]|uniref:hypothetical protein n=1 Tax=Streptomyces sp. ET3-23 TaxID=2885643 RepID=UPI001D10A038|nr:hypothetical protein [Streptomyces sp. ET3-23]MCC2274781.1 hypothetical protein [Streptomyces sp. ET3-23]